jgi:hypothetical protein
MALQFAGAGAWADVRSIKQNDNADRSRHHVISQGWFATEAADACDLAFFPAFALKDHGGRRGYPGSREH